MAITIMKHNVVLGFSRTQLFGDDIWRLMLFFAGESIQQECYLIELSLTCQNENVTGEVRDKVVGGTPDHVMKAAV